MGCNDDYRKTCSEMLQRFSQTEKAVDAWHVASACALAPDTARDWATAIALADKALQSDSTSDETLSVLGGSLYRAGRFDEAFMRLSEAAALIQEPSPASELSPAYPWFFLAMAQHSRGNSEEAKQWLDKALAMDREVLCRARPRRCGPSLELALAQTVRDEATTLLGVTLPTAEPAPEPAAKVEEAQELPKSTPAPEAAKEEEPPK